MMKLVRSFLLSKDAAASKARQEALAKKYKLHPDILEIAADLDFTPNGAYTEWLVKALLETHSSLKGIDNLGDYHRTTVQEYLGKMIPFLKTFNRLKNSPAWSATNSKNILDYDVEKLLKTVRESDRESLSKKEQLRELQRRKEHYLSAGAELLGERNGLLLFRATTAEALAILGEGSHWCTKNEAYGRQYLRNGEMFVAKTLSPNSSSQYHSDNYAQFFIPNSFQRDRQLEIQDVDGDDLVYQDDKLYRVDASQDWEMIKWVAEYSPNLQKYISRGWVYSGDDPHGAIISMCDYCGELIDDEVYRAWMRDAELEFDTRSCLDRELEVYFEEEVWDKLPDKAKNVVAEKGEMEGVLKGEAGAEPLRTWIQTSRLRALEKGIEERKDVPGGFDAFWHRRNLTHALDNDITFIRTTMKLPDLTVEQIREAREQIEDFITNVVNKAENFKKDLFSKFLNEVTEQLQTGEILEVDKIAYGYLHELESKTSALNIDAAASEARKKTLQQKYGLDWEIVSALANADPTHNGTYTEWLCRITKNEFNLDEPGAHHYFQEFLEDATELLTEFTRLKNNPQWQGKKDINAYKSFQDLGAVLQQAGRLDLSKKEQLRELQRRKNKYLESGAEFLGDVGDYSCFEVTEPEAACLLGEGSHWCTKNRGYAQNYLDKGTLYVFVTHDPNSSDRYNSDRYAQMFVPDNGVGRFEFQDVDGRDLGSHMLNNSVYTLPEDQWWMVEFVAQHNKALKRYVESRQVTTGELPDWVEVCPNCSDEFIANDEDQTETPTLWIDGDSKTYCSWGCGKEAARDYFFENIEDKLVLPDLSQEQEQYRNHILPILNGEKDTVTSRLCRRFNEAAERVGITSPKQSGNFDLKWYIGNARGSLQLLRRIQETVDADVAKRDREKLTKVYGNEYPSIPELEEAHRVLTRFQEEDSEFDEFDLEYTKDEFVQVVMKGDAVNGDEWANEYNAEIKKDADESRSKLQTYLKTSSRKVRIAAATVVDSKLVNSLIYRIEQIIEESEPFVSIPMDHQLRRGAHTTEWEIPMEELEEDGGLFLRDDNSTAKGIRLLLRMEPAGANKPIIYEGGMVYEVEPGWPLMILYVNGDLTRQEALQQLQNTSPQFDEIKTVVKHELFHMQDSEVPSDLSEVEVDGEIPDEVLLNIPAEVRAWSVNLKDEFASYISPEMVLNKVTLDAFLRTSRVWKFINQHMNAQNRKHVLGQLEEEMERLRNSQPIDSELP